MSKKVLITGIDSFTGKHLSGYLEKSGFDVYGTSLFSSADKKYQCDITEKDQIMDVLKTVTPEYLIHLSGISFAAHGNNEDFYRVNTIGTINILDAFIALKIKPVKIVLASSATVYGNQGLEVLDESLCPKPANHYGASKYAMECLASGYFDKLPLIITRPFNYTGAGQAEHFLIPKIVSHYKEKKQTIELGNLYVGREFNDIQFVCEIYQRLLEAKTSGEVVNIASNHGIKLLDVIEMMNTLAGYEIEVKVNPAFVRANEIKSLTGSTKKLEQIVGAFSIPEFRSTLLDMYNS
ncbi:GDP-mannose 4,6-dehydratase [Sulfurovum sp.]|uniref:GDP-mannose 4,6-dehydratase n=1 Tax=Sulfurovum sp. TaxID=1969726 RepID=UPI0025D28096|nr:GDP-mannose 4,6-dehydratase [Sulfurovum sp.]